jgi:predicted ATP-dependent endonuclease of OLD family
MELKRIRLRRFKAFETAEIEVSPLTVLIGPNNAGKSTILQALVLLAQSANGAQFLTRGYVDLGNDPRSLTHQSEKVSESGQEWGIEVEWEAPVPGGVSSGLSVQPA